MIIEKLLSISKMLVSDEPLLPDRLIRGFFVLMQFFFGLLWLEGASWKIIVDGKLAANYDGLAYWVKRGSEFPVLDLYKQLIDSVILPNIKFFLPLVFLTELTIGILYVAGRKVRLASLLSLVQTGAVILSVYKAPHEWKWSYLLMLMISGLFFVKPTPSQWPSRIFKQK